jgi:hypothetical protein
LIIFLSILLTFGTYFHYAYTNLDSETFFQFIPWIVIQTIYAFYSTAIFLYTTTYFNTICINLENKFKQIHTSVKDLAKSKREFLRSNGLNTFLIIDKSHTEMSITFNRLLNIMSLSHLLNQLSFVFYIVYFVSVIPNIYLLKTSLILFTLPIALQSYLFLDFNFKNLKNVEKKVSILFNVLCFLTFYFYTQLSFSLYFLIELKKKFS